MNHKTDMQAKLQRIASELRAYNPAADEYKGEHIHKVWARKIEAALASRPDAQAKTGTTGWKLAMRVMQSDLFDKLDDAERAECDALVRANPYFGRNSAPDAQADERGAFQSRVHPWMLACFGSAIAADTVERNHRFFEEAAELVQACGMTASEAHQLVDYTWSRPVGEKTQEVGGVMVTLAALCLANGLDMHAAGETELARISDPETMAKIRAKQAAKPKNSPLPEARAAAPQAEAAPEPKQIKAPDIILTGAQLLEALDFIAPDRDSDQLESEAAFAYGEGHSGKAMYVWCADYPEEGSFVCDGSSAAASPKAEAAQGVPAGWSDQARKALAPFASIGQWLFARSLPDDTPVVDVRGLNGQASALTRGMFKAAHMALASAPSPDREQVGEACIAPACHQWDGTDRCTCQRHRTLDTLKRVATALPVLRTMLATEGLGGVEVADEMLSDIRALLGEKADASPSRDRGEQECPHGVDDGACGWCYDEKAASMPTSSEQPQVAEPKELYFKRSPFRGGWTTFNIRDEDADEAERRLLANGE